ncbi:hypothetical protein A2688_02905 [Candidatus Daviesbacteria bacterium RIFCSPHIGHO2_01_FULL_38_8]|nr:MAG: hypothetical protein A2688_02905 [Candidatus Daviesbacteria bacterium RIFCSPHIGHO2_01_FULL_38_8]
MTIWLGNTEYLYPIVIIQEFPNVIFFRHCEECSDEAILYNENMYSYVYILANTTNRVLYVGVTRNFLKISMKLLKEKNKSRAGQEKRS